MKRHDQHFTVEYDYPVLFTRNVFDPKQSLLTDTINRLGEDARHRVIVFIDEGVSTHHPELSSSIQIFADAHVDIMELVREPTVVVGGEAIKNDYRLVMEILDTILEYQMCRHSFVMAIGGGAVLDAVGFAASLVHRGLRVLRLPTTVLAQNDAGVGVKTGMNLHGSKNTIGTFHPPFAVINDFDFLKTLSDTDWSSGIAEAFKVALIKDKSFFESLLTDAPLLQARDESAMERMVIRCAELHLEHIRTNGDPFELGKARPLDFGHWAAHKLEAMTGYTITHGHAVGIGLLIDSFYAAHKGWIADNDFDAIYFGLKKSGLPVWHDALMRSLGDGTLEVLGGIADFQEHLGGELCVTFPDGIGQRREEHTMDSMLVSEAVEELRLRSRSSHACSTDTSSSPDILS